MVFGAYVSFVSLVSSLAVQCGPRQQCMVFAGACFICVIRGIAGFPLQQRMMFGVCVPFALWLLGSLLQTLSGQVTHMAQLTCMGGLQGAVLPDDTHNTRVVEQGHMVRVGHLNIGWWFGARHVVS